ncbi:sensor histidine kinase [Pontibacter silvestris]|uniref:Sensor histidine kinase n=2 Tax=Pontibacter silvestris TaxID=2305183 RepID=A0ABW4X5R2_9BACT|nr:histidine kinase [Pontibacter silvestris]MCC9138805.1 histidine kinase [Pontibacter silvestris]
MYIWIKNSLIRTIQENRFHLIGWFVFIAYEVAAVGLLTGKFATLGDYTVHYVLNILLFYVHAYLILPHAFRKKNQIIWIFPLMIVLEILLYVFTSYAVEFLGINYFGLTTQGTTTLNFAYLIRALWRFIYIGGFSTAYYFLITLHKEQRRTEELEKLKLKNIIEKQNIEQELIKAQNAFLRAQINPHFLFNTLNFIYNKARKTAPVAAETIITLSEMMRFAVQADQHQDAVLLGDEIEQVEKLVYLHQLRQNHQLQVQINYTEEVKYIKLIPLVLLTVVENVFKHGNLLLPAHQAAIRLYINNNQLFIETDNLVYNKPSSPSLHSGLKNIRQRLHHAYGARAKLTSFEDDRKHFRLRLTVSLDALEYPALVNNSQGEMLIR